MAETIMGTVVLAVIVLGVWMLRYQSRQYPRGTRIPMDEERKSEQRWTGMWHRGGGGGL